MAIAILAALFAQGAAGPVGEAMAADLRAAERAVAHVRVCAELDPERLEETHRAFTTRLFGLEAAAAALWPDGEPLRARWKEEDGTPTRAPCSDEAFAAARDGAEAAMDSAQALVNEALGPERRRGLWLGGLKVCGARSADFTNSHGFPLLTLWLDPAQTPALARVTQERVGRTLAIWLNGEAISAPHIHEPLLGGAVTISGIDEALPVIAAAAKAPC